MLDKNISLRSPIAALFKEEDVTVVSILTAISMKVSTIFLTTVNSVKSVVVPNPSLHPKPPHPDPDPSPH